MTDTEGHVFVVHGDLRNLACDAWLLPCGRMLYVEGYWLKGMDVDRSDLPGEWTDDDHAQVVDAWPADRPRPVLTDVVSGSRPVDRHVDAVRRFVELSVGLPRFLTQRELPLLGLPLVGTGHAGSRRRAGEVADKLLPALHDLARRHRVDLALVCRDADAYAAAQAARRDLPAARSPVGLGSSLMETAVTLAARAREGQLVLFIGAGVSQGAGLPGWNELLARLAGQAALDDPRGELGGLDYLDQAQALHMAFGESRSMGQAVREELAGSPCHSLGHALLAALPAAEAVTTNYDQLFE